jgi:hypothetical protein
MFKNNRVITAAVMITVVVVLILWDLVAFFTGTGIDTESGMILEFGYANFTLPFAMGGLLGHFFWPRDKPLFGLSVAQSFFGVVIPLLTVMGIVDIFYTTPSWLLPWLPVIGFPIGSFFWPQRKQKQ